MGYSTKGEEFYFDLEDYDKIKDYYWRVDNLGYVITGYKEKEKVYDLKMHRLIMNAKENENVDHIFFGEYSYDNSMN